MKKLHIKIGGMHCASCVMLIEGDLEDCSGIKCATCNYAKGECVVETDIDVSHKDIEKIITNDGYSVLSLEEI